MGGCARAWAGATWPPPYHLSSKDPPPLVRPVGPSANHRSPSDPHAGSPLLFTPHDGRLMADLYFNYILLHQPGPLPRAPELPLAGLQI